MTVFKVSDEDRYLEFDDPSSGKPVQVYPSSETGQLSSGTRRVSKTWKFELEGLTYRVQLQVQDLKGVQSDKEAKRR